MTIAVGDTLPDGTLFEMTPDGPKAVPVAEVFGGRTVALFAVPGAFTPTCHNKHMPSFVENAAALKAKGVDEIICLTVNDPFVARAWGEATGADKAGIRLLCDADASFVTAMGLSFDASGAGLGHRAQRFSAVVRDGKLASLNLEDAPSKAEVTKADVLLGQL
ncbi:MAG: peroxiredoxin [Thermohalobaculum sp.]|nr:peroxiredoxin [Thermohalobaculum sp.]